MTIGYGNEYIAIYLAISALLFLSITQLKAFAVHARLYTYAWLYRLVLACIFTTLLLTCYNGGDFPTYYVLAAKQAQLLHTHGLSEIRQMPASGAYMPAFLFSLIFYVLPPSIYGITLLNATVSQLFFMYLFKTFETKTTNKALLFFLIFFIPSIVMQSCYVGKESFLIPILLLLIIFCRKFTARRLIILLLLLPILYETRKYELIIWLAALGATLFLHKKGYLKLLMLAGLLIMAYIGFQFSENLQHYLSMQSTFNIESMLSVIYSGGQLGVTPPAQPFTFLQLFRPLPWEGVRFLAMIQSIQNTVLLLLFIYLAIQNWRNIATAICYDRQYTFLVLLAGIQGFLFSYDPNLGDLSRRIIYIFPALMIILLANEPSHPALKPHHKDEHAPDLVETH